MAGGSSYCSYCLYREAFGVSSSYGRPSPSSYCLYRLSPVATRPAPTYNPGFPAQSTHCSEGTSMPYGFGIIGCGMIADFHAKAIADTQGGKLVACYDNFPAAAEKLAAAHGIKAYAKLDDML